MTTIIERFLFSLFLGAMVGTVTLLIYAVYVSFFERDLAGASFVFLIAHLIIIHARIGLIMVAREISNSKKNLIQPYLMILPVIVLFYFINIETLLALRLGAFIVMGVLGVFQSVQFMLEIRGSNLYLN